VSAELERCKRSIASTASVMSGLGVSGDSAVSATVAEAVQAVNDKWRVEIETLEATHRESLKAQQARMQALVGPHVCLVAQRCIRVNGESCGGAQVAKGHSDTQEVSARLTQAEYELNASRDELLEALTVRGG
jgi:hypothetical protein